MPGCPAIGSRICIVCLVVVEDGGSEDQNQVASSGEEAADKIDIIKTQGGDKYA